MIFIKELQRLTNIEHLRLIAGQEGLGRTVTTAVLFEYDPSRVLTPDFYEGDLVLTTLSYARGEPELVDQSLITLLRQNVAGIVIKTAYFSKVSDEVLALANQMGTPVFLFDNTYIEDVLLQVMDLIRGNSRFRGYEKDLHALMQGGLSHMQIRDVLKNLNAGQMDEYEVIGMYPEGPMSDYERAVLLAFERNHDLERSYTFMEMDRMMLALHRLNGPETSGGGTGTAWLADEMKIKSMKDNRCGIGISSRMSDPYLIGNAIWEAVIAARVSAFRNNEIIESEMLGIDAYILPMMQSPFLSYRCQQDWKRLTEYDDENHSALAETAETYVEKDLDVAATAAAMFQHTNTIRYRLKKIRSLMGCDSEVMFHAMLYLVIHLKRMMDNDGL